VVLDGIDSFRWFLILDLSRALYRGFDIPVRIDWKVVGAQTVEKDPQGSLSLRIGMSRNGKPILNLTPHDSM